MQNVKLLLEERLYNGFDGSIRQSLSKAIDIFKEHTWSYVIFSVILLVASSVSSMAAVIILAPLHIGVALYTEKVIRGENASFDDFFKGFDKFGKLAVISLISLVTVILGFIALILPGIFLAVSFSWAGYIGYFTDLSPSESIKKSMKIIANNWFKVFLLGLTSFFVTFSGLLFFGVGILFTLPVAMIMSYIFFRDIMIDPRDEIDLYQTDEVEVKVSENISDIATEIEDEIDIISDDEELLNRNIE